jgi:GAF domain-containing protein
MGLKATTVRMSEDLWELLEEESARQGVSAAHLVRDAVLLRLGHLSAQRGDASATLTIAELAGRSLDERRQFDRGHHERALAEPKRLMRLQQTGLVDGAADPGLETLAQLCAKLLDIPVALISLVDTERQFFAASCGLPQPWADQRQTRLSHSFCQHVVVSRQPFVVSDARDHPLVKENLAIRDLGVIAYAGVPLATDDGDVLGSFCAIDNQPRNWSRADLATLNEFADSAMAHIKSRETAAVAA